MYVQLGVSGLVSEGLVAVPHGDQDYAARGRMMSEFETSIMCPRAFQ